MLGVFFVYFLLKSIVLVFYEFNIFYIFVR